MGDNYSANVSSGQSLWYSAWTFDLPLTVTFEPRVKTDPAPLVEMDFTCDGVYEDSILCSMFCKTSTGNGIQFDMPHKPELKSKTLDNGTFVYYLSLGEKYRDLLFKMGITYNLQVYVKVTYQGAGTISMAPDDMFTSCVDNAKFMHFGDTVKVQSLDKKRHVIVPYVQWQEDSILYKWEGTTPCQLTIGNGCDFDPTDNDPDGVDLVTYRTIQPNSSFKVTADLLHEYVTEWSNEAGLYFAKFYSEEPGAMKIEKVPQSPPRGNATLLRYERTYALNANETALFAIPKSWTDSVQFTTPTKHRFTMVIASDPDFAEEHVLKTYPFLQVESGHWLGILGTELIELWKKTTEPYLYIRFDCSEATTVYPSLWSPSECVTKKMNNLYPVRPDTTFTVQSRSNGGNYRLLYSQWKGGDMKLTMSQLSGSTVCQVFFATDCGISTSQTASNLLVYRSMSASKKTIIITAETIAGWADRVSEEGYIYARFHNADASYKMKVSTTAPEDADPVYPASSVAVVCEGEKVLVKVSAPQTVVITDEAGEEKDRWEADPETPHELNLPAGKYTLQGETEKIELNL